MSKKKSISNIETFSFYRYVSDMKVTKQVKGKSQIFHCA